MLTCALSGLCPLLLPPRSIDEVHTLVGAGSVGRGGGGGSGLDISNLIKPALARGEFQVCVRGEKGEGMEPRLCDTVHCNLGHAP